MAQINTNSNWVVSHISNSTTPDANEVSNYIFNDPQLALNKQSELIDWVKKSVKQNKGQVIDWQVITFQDDPYTNIHFLTYIFDSDGKVTLTEIVTVNQAS